MTDQQQQDRLRQSPIQGSPNPSLQADPVIVENLPLEKKLEVLKKYNSMEFYEEGRYIDAQDSVNAWCLGQIEQVDQRSLNVHFDGWSNRWDVWYKANSYKVAPFRKFSRGYTGQNKVALRKLSFNMDDLHIQKQRVEKLIEDELNGLGAFMTTQYFRGELYIYVDFLLGTNTYDAEQIDAVNDFLYAILRLIVTWLKKIPKIMGLYQQLKVNSDLFLIDENIAILQCHSEFLDILKKMFCLCHRCIRYYLLHDKNPLQFEQAVTQSFESSNFEKQRKKDEEDYDLDEIKENIIHRKNLVYGQFINFVNYFAQIGGFDAILDVLRMGMAGDTEDKVPLDLISSFTTPFRNCGQIFSPTFSQSFVAAVKDIVFTRLKNMSEKELKEVDKEVVGRVLNDLKDFLSLGMSEQETSQLIEQTQLFVALRFLKSTYLEKRLKGLNDIKLIIDRIEAGQKQQAIKQQQMAQGYNRVVQVKGSDQDVMMSGQGLKLKPPKWLNQEILKDWILEQKVLETVLGENTHLEIVKRSGCILKFLAKENALPAGILDLLWKCQQGKHEEMVRVVYNTIKDLVPFISLDYIDILYEKIQSVPHQQYDEKFLVFLKDFTMKALENFAEIKNNEISMSETQTYDYEELSQKREESVLQTFEQHLNSANKGLEGDEKLYGLPIFWDLIQDKATFVNAEMAEQAINSVTEILKQPFSRHIRMTYLLRAVENLRKQESVTQSIIIANSIINDYPEHQYMDAALSLPTIVIQLEKQVQIVNLIIKNIMNYHHLVKEKMKHMAEKKKQLPEDLVDHIFVGKHTHENSLSKMLEFLEFIVIGSGQEVTLGTENIDTLWRIFVQQPNFNSDQTLFLTWINRSREYGYNKHEQFLFSDDEKKYFFTKILCNPTYVDFQKISIGQVKCFHKYFKVINKQDGYIEIVQRKKLRVVDFSQLIGLDTLWSIAIESENDKVREESMDLLVDLHLKFDSGVSLVEQQEIWDNFIKKCMHNLEQDNTDLICNTIHILSKFLDRYEGKKSLKPELKISQHFSNIQPLNVTVFNKTDQSRKSVHVSYFQTIGFLRTKIAEAYDYHINEFVMTIKNQFIDPEEEDEKYIKDFGLIQQVLIQKNPQYIPENHPKYLIANNQLYFDKLFYLLSTEKTNLVEPTWDLLTKLPVNAKLQQDIKELTGVVEDKANWNKILDPTSTHKLLYCLKIVNSLHSNKTDPKSKQWRYKFVQSGGFSHLLTTFVNLDIKRIDTFLTIKCIDSLIIILYEFLQMDRGLVNEVMNRKEQFVIQCIGLIDLVCDFTIVQEQKRGESYEDINKRLQQSKLKKSKYKSYVSGNKGADKQQQQQQMQNEEEDDHESQEQNQIQQIYKAFQEEGQLVQNLFKFMLYCVISNEQSSVVIIASYPNLEQMLFKGMLRSENMLIRNEISRKMKEIISIRSQKPEIKQLQQIIAILLFKIQQHTQEFDYRSNIFFEGVTTLIESLHQSDIIDMHADFKVLIFNLASEILKREIREKNTQDVDHLLSGKMKLIKVLLQKFPEYKLPIGEQLTSHLLHNCLFEVPQGGSTKSQNQAGSPKCKSTYSRQQAAKLLAVLCRDCIPNLRLVLAYMSKFNENPSWRTNKEHDWNISLMESEKSSTGYVGIKNLGCICYMNSLFQQLFMIPSLRNDVLTVRDPAAATAVKEENMLYQLQVLFTGLLKSEKQYVNPKGFCHSFKDWEGNPTNVLEQMDVEEFFNMFMDRLENAIKGTPQEKTIQYHFGGVFANEMICKGCPHSYERQEPFLSISVPVKNKKSIQEGLQSFIQGDMLEGENAYSCEKCDKKVDTLKRTCVKKLPRNLVLALKRFDFDFDKMIRVKINEYCEFPMELNMEPYTQEGLARREKAAKQKEERGEDAGEEMEISIEPLKYPKEYYEYTLSGIVVHSGTADSGHYYSFIKDRDHPEANKWYEMNDHLVREFDPADIPGECFGGEDTFQGYNMVQMKSMKWRNAYLLVYQRKVPFEQFSDEEDEALKQLEKSQVNKNMLSGEDVQMQPVNNTLSIPPEIEEKIAYENQKYWQNRFLFGNEYHEFVYDISLNWNSTKIIPKYCLTKNDDFHLTKYEKPPEYEKDDNIPLPLDEPLDLTKQFTQQEIDDCELRVFKYAAGFYITILQRAMNKSFIPSMLNLLKSYMNKNPLCAQWLISEFCNEEIIQENLLQCSQKEMRKFLQGLLYCAMLKVYEMDKQKLNQYWLFPQGDKNGFTVLGNFVLILIKNMYDLKRFIANFSQYFQLIARFSSLGPEAREFLLRARMIGRLMDFFYEDASPYKEEFRNMNDIYVELKDKPEIGLPTQIDKKQMSYFQEMMERRRMKNLMDAIPKYKYLIETVSNCVKSCKFGPVPTPYQLDTLNFDQLQQSEKDLLFPEAKFIKRFLAEAKRNRAINCLCSAFCHFSWSDTENFKELTKTVIQGLQDNDFDEVKPFLMMMQYLLAHPSEDFATKVDYILTNFLDTVKQNCNFYKFMETMYEFIFKITSRNEFARNWFYQKTASWEWLMEWVKEYKQPPNPISQNSSIRLFKRRGNQNQMMQHNNMYKIDQARGSVMTQYRFRRLTQMLEGSVPDLKEEIDIDLVDMQDYKFKLQEVVDYYIKKQDRIQTVNTEIVLDEMIQCKFYGNSGQNDSQYSLNWVSCDTDKFMPGMTYRNLYRTKLIETISAQLERKRMETGNNIIIRNNNNPNDGDDDMQDAAGNLPRDQFRGNASDEDEDSEHNQDEDLYS